MKRKATTFGRESSEIIHTSIPGRGAVARESTAHGGQIPLVIQRLQQTVGNRGTGQWLQTKLKIGAPNDAREREADHVADQVVGGSNLAAAPGNSIPTQPAGQLQPRCREGEEETRLRRQGMGTGPGVAPPLVNEVLNSPGQRLDRATRDFMEPRLGHNLGNVRIHTDGKAQESARAIKARAYSVSQDIVFGAGEYSSTTAGGRWLMAHELAHVLQNDIGQPDLISRKPVPEITKDVIDKEEYVNPEAAGGVGDFPAAFAILTPLDTDTLLQVFVELQKHFHLDLIRANAGSAGADFSRMDICAAAVQHVTHRLPDTELAGLSGRVAGLDQPVRDALQRFFSKYPRHVSELFLQGPEAELERLAKMKADELTATAQAEADAEKKRLETEAKAKGQAAPPAPAAEVGKTLEKQVKSRAVPALPTAPWDNLKDEEKKKWKDEHAPRAIREIEASIKGTELEDVMKGKGWEFDPPKILSKGGYAAQDGNQLLFGTAFVKDVIDPDNPKKAATPKNVWGILAHEMGGHFEYGPEYAGKFMARVLGKLPAAEQQKYKDPEMARQFYSSFSYAETEIFAALRQRAYDVPVSGAALTHGAIKPDDNIEARLKQIDTGFPREVGEAILVELKWKVDAETKILDRDKKYFADQLKKHGWSIP